MRTQAYSCDWCHNTVSENDVEGGELPIGWINIRSEHFLEEDEFTIKNTDFCSQACLMQWISSPEWTWNKV